MRRLGALAGVVAMLLWASPVTAAEPGAVSTSPTLSLAELGSSSTLTFYVNNEYPGASVSFPVPWGLDPVALRAKVELPLNIRSAGLHVKQGDRTLARLNLPLQDQAPLTIPLDGLQVSGGWASFDLAMDALPLDNQCWNDAARVQLVDTSITFRGNEKPPGNVADFLAAVLNKVTIGVPARPSLAESSAAVQVAAAVAQRNGQSPEVSIVPLPDGRTSLNVPSAPMERQIIVKEGGEKGLALQGSGGVPSLLISGKGPELAEQARLLTDESLRLAVSPKAVAGLLPEPDVLGDKATVAELGNPSLTSEATWPKVGIGLDQTRFGRPLSNVQVHLVGSYTPVARDFGGEVTASVGGEVIDRWPASPDGVIDRTVTIPDRLMKRYMSLEVGVRIAGNLGQCSDQMPTTLRIDGSTTIDAATANPPVPQGFQAFPQTLMPTVQFGIGADVLADTRRAAEIAVGFQRVSRVPLLTEVTTLDQAVAGGGSAILIAADGWSDPALALPFSADRGQLKVAGMDPKGDPLTMTLDPGTTFGSVQTVFDGSRSLLVFTSNGAPDQLDALLTWLAKPGRWAGLDGRALISLTGAEPITVPNPPLGHSAQPASSSGEQGWFWWVAGGVAAIAAVGALLILLRARRGGAG